jgi:aryl-alcohol dehydrogenase-like predicted oxidoreductase
LAEQIQEPWPGTVSISGPEGRAARDWYEAEQMALFTWSSLAGGFFSGRLTRQNLDTFDNGPDMVCIRSYGYEVNFKRLDRVRLLAKETGLTIPQVALAYVFNQPMNIFAIVGCRKSNELDASAEAVAVRLSPQEIAWLELKTDTR